jgi:hypothetical protein
MRARLFFLIDLDTTLDRCSWAFYKLSNCVERVKITPNENIPPSLSIARTPSLLKSILVVYQHQPEIKIEI